MAYYYIFNNKIIAKSEKDILNIPGAKVKFFPEDIQDFENYKYDENEDKIKFSQEFKIKIDKEKLQEEKIKKIKELKEKRENKIKKIKVRLINGAILDADPKSQEKFKNCVLTLDDSEKEFWIDADNNKTELSKEDFIEALKLARREETKIIIKFQQLREKINQAQTFNELNQIDIDDF